MPQSSGEKEAFASVSRRSKAELLDLLRIAYRTMSESQRRAVFKVATPVRRMRTKRPPIVPLELVRAVTCFHRDSLARKYYAPFMIDSKNFMHIPEQTTRWCAQFASLAKEACKLVTQQNHSEAARCFSLLYELLEAMESGDKDIIFAHECGGWLIPADEKAWIKAYLRSLAATATPEEFARAVMPMLWRDSTQSFASDVHGSAMKVATRPQQVAMEAERIRRGIRAPGEPRPGRGLDPSGRGVAGAAGVGARALPGQ